MKPVSKGELSRASATHFWLKSDQSGQVLLQLKESGGEGFFVVLQATDEWTEARLPLSEFQVDGDKRRDGKLQADQLTEILIADPGAISEVANGSRRIWLSE